VRGLKLFVAGFIAILLLTVVGCGETEPVTPATVSVDQAPPTRTYSTSPESTSELLRDASQAVGAATADNKGVQFNLQSTGSVEGDAEGSRSVGDMIFPDRVQMVTREYLTPQPVSTDVIVIGGQTYIRSESTGGNWIAGVSPSTPPDPQLITGYLDFARSSRNFGQETLVGGRKTYHVQVDVDMPLLVASLIKNNPDPAMQARYKGMEADVVTVDYWIDANNRLPYQMLVKSLNQNQRENLEQNFNFSNWGETVAIAKPCENC